MDLHPVVATGPVVVHSELSVSVSTRGSGSSVPVGARPVCSSVCSASLGASSVGPGLTVVAVAPAVLQWIVVGVVALGDPFATAGKI